MKILVSAFACLPNAGSEGGVGWRWAQEWAKEHEVVVITDTYRCEQTEAYLAQYPTSNPRIVFYRPRWLKWIPINSLTAQALYQLWQIALYFYVRRLLAVEHFDLAHHVTYGVFRHPSLVGRAGIPLVFGPVGGGEDAPWRLKKSLPFASKIRGALRTGLNRFARVDPLLRWGLGGCSLIFVKTAATARALPHGFEDRTTVALEIGTIARDGVTPRVAPRGRPLRLLFAGRLLGWKGVHLALAAIARARTKGAVVEFHVIGDGAQALQLRRLATMLSIDDVVRWTATMPQTELFAVYREVDAVLFPSLHDSSGNVVVEALSFALPVVCLDLGGPADIVTDDSGCVIRTGELSETEVVEELAIAILRLTREPELYERLSAGALARSSELSWDSQMACIKSLALGCVYSTQTAEGLPNETRKTANRQQVVR